MKTTFAVLAAFSFAWALRSPEVSMASDKLLAWVTASNDKLEKTIQDQQKYIDSLSAALIEANKKIEAQEVQISYYKIRLLRHNVSTKVAKSIAVNTQIYSKRYGVDPDMVLAIARVESYFDPYAISRTGAKGLMQIMPSYWEAKCGKKLFDIETSINCGLLVFTTERERFQSDELALIAYNVGAKDLESMLKGKKKLDRKYSNAVQKVLRRIKKSHLSDKEYEELIAEAY